MPIVMLLSVARRAGPSVALPSDYPIEPATMPIAVSSPASRVAE
jgi:hypothetical protein